VSEGKRRHNFATSKATTEMEVGRKSKPRHCVICAMGVQLTICQQKDYATRQRSRDRAQNGIQRQQPRRQSTWKARAQTSATRLQQNCGDSTAESVLTRWPGARALPRRGTSSAGSPAQKQSEMKIVSGHSRQYQATR
jgi:hypothetical protein